MFTIIGGEYLKRWEKDREIQVNDSSVDKVYFTTKARDGAVEVEVSGGIAKVPNGLLQQAHDITVYGYVGDKCKLKVLAVKDREKPEDYYYYDGYKENVENIENGIAPKALDECIREMEDIPNGGSGTGGSGTGGAYETVDSKILKFDGNLEGRVTVELSLEEQTMTLVHVSDIAPTLEQLNEGGYYVNALGVFNGNETLKFGLRTNNEPVDFGGAISCGQCFVALNDNASLEGLITLPKTGIYFAGMELEGGWYGVDTFVTKSETLNFGKTQYPKNSVVTINGWEPQNSGSVYSLNTTYDEIMTLLSLGNLPIIKIESEGTFMGYYMLEHWEYGTGLKFTHGIDILTINQDNVITHSKTK